MILGVMLTVILALIPVVIPIGIADMILPSTRP
jgi:hypothetical protein